MKKRLWVVISLAGVSLAGFAIWYSLRPIRPPCQEEIAASREEVAATLTQCIGLSARDAIQRLGIAEAEWFWCDEPPAILRGVTYFPTDGRSLTLYITKGEPLFRRFSEDRKWDYAAFLDCRVGGIQYTSGPIHLDIGADVPWQFR